VASRVPYRAQGRAPFGILGADMSLHSPALSRIAPRAMPRIVSDLRRHRRVMLDLQGRFMRADRNEYTCKLRDISVGGASLMTSVPVELGERIVAYLDQLGGLEGTVSRILDGGFALHFKVSAHKREKLAAQLTWLINRDAFPEAAGRQHERIGAAGRRTRLKIEDGIFIDCDILDYSASGISLGTSARPPVGTDVLVGKLKAIVRRHHDKGIGLQFAQMQDTGALKASFG
jgi:hypothetical protein